MYVTMDASGRAGVSAAGQSALSQVQSAEAAFQRITYLNQGAETLYRIARVAPASLFRKNRKK